MPTLIEYTKLPGVQDLTSRIRAKLAQALKKEDEGDMAGAQIALEEAILAEEQLQKVA